MKDRRRLYRHDGAATAVLQAGDDAAEIRYHDVRGALGGYRDEISVAILDVDILWEFAPERSGLAGIKRIAVEEVRGFEAERHIAADSGIHFYDAGIAATLRQRRLATEYPRRHDEQRRKTCVEC